MGKTPTKKQILELAKQLYFEDMARSGVENFNTPEPSELAESGYIALAQSILMRDMAKASVSEWEAYDSIVQNVKEELNLIFEDSQKDFFNIEYALRSGFVICGNSGSGKTNLAKLLAEKLRQNGIIVYVLDSSRAWLDFPFDEVIEVSNDKTRYEWFGSTLFDISQLDIPSKVRFADLLCKTLLKAHMEGYSVSEFLIFEEAQLFLPNNALRNLDKYGNILALASIGRNYGLRYGLVSQFPSYVDKFFVRNAQQRYFGYIYEPNDFRYVKQILGKEWVEQLKSLDVGQFVYQCRDQITKIKVPLYASGTSFAYQVVQK